MQHAFTLAGYAAAHALWIVADTGVLIPFVMEDIPLPGSKPQQYRRLHTTFAADTVQASLEQAEQRMHSDPEQAECAVLVHDGYIHFNIGRRDALLIDICVYTPQAARFRAAIPYRPATDPAGVAVYRPKVLGWPENTSPDFASLFQAFFAGVDTHREGGALWERALDESL